MFRLNHPSLGRRYLLDFSASFHAIPFVRIAVRCSVPSPTVLVKTPRVFLDLVGSMIGIGTSIPSGYGIMITWVIWEHGLYLVLDERHAWTWTTWATLLFISSMEVTNIVEATWLGINQPSEIGVLLLSGKPFFRFFHGPWSWWARGSSLLSCNYYCMWGSDYAFTLSHCLSFLHWS